MLRLMVRNALLALAVLLVASPAGAKQGEAPRRAPFTPGPPVALPECTCRAEGRDWLLGETICLKTPTGERLARCIMDQNVTSWRVSDVPCATSARHGTVHARLIQIRASTVR